MRIDYWEHESTSSYQSQNLLKPNIKYIWDNTRWFFIYPVKGSRIYVKYEVAPQSNSNDFFAIRTLNLHSIIF